MVSVIICAVVGVAFDQISALSGGLQRSLLNFACCHHVLGIGVASDDPFFEHQVLVSVVVRLSVRAVKLVGAVLLFTPHHLRLSSEIEFGVLGSRLRHFTFRFNFLVAGLKV